MNAARWFPIPVANASLASEVHVVAANFKIKTELDERFGGVDVRIVRLPHGKGLPLPSYQSEHAAGLDLIAALPADQPLTLAARARALIPTGIALALPAGHEAQVRPRSGLAARQGVTVLNAPGTIDADYRGEIQVLLINFGDEPVAITRGMRIAQLVIAPVTVARLREVPSLDETARGPGGFGSTGGC
jgi:dUTP pyrophosphatase